MNHKVIIGLPAYNEGQVLHKLLDSIQPLRQEMGEAMEVLVVNDGSTDTTEKTLEEYSSRYPCIHYLNHPQNRGLGAAMSTLFANVIERCDENDILVTLDADNTHRPEIIPHLVNMLEQEGLDVVIASRFTRGGREIGLSIPRKICSRGAGLFLRTFFPIPNVKDYSCGFRAYRLGYLKRAIKLYNGQIITCSGFECMAEILARFSKIGVSIGEYPLELHYELKKGASKMRLTRTILGYFRLLRVVKKPLAH